jgi:hypothetical protein
MVFKTHQLCWLGIKGTGLCVCEATPLFSRPYLYCEREVPQYLSFNERVADSQKLRGVNLKYWVTATL